MKGCCAKICTSTVRQHLASIAAGHGALSLGIALAWGLLAIPAILKSNDLGALTPDQIKWISTAPILGAAFGCIPGGIIADKIGRRRGMLIGIFPWIFGMLGMGVARSAELLIFGRFLAGFGGGMLTAIIPLYVTEYSQDGIRGQIGYSFLQQMMAGLVFILFSGHGMENDWTILAYKNLPISLIVLFGMYFLPESPRFLFMKGENVEGLRTLQWFRITTERAESEDEAKKIQQRAERLSTDARPLLSSVVLRPVLISGCLHFLTSMTLGVPLILGTFLVTPLVAGSLPIPSLILAGGIIPLLAAAIGSNLVDKLGRKGLLMSSGTLMTLSAFTLSLCFWIQNGELQEIEGKLVLIRAISFGIYVFGFGVGFGPISWIIMGELAPDRARGIGAGIISLFFWIPTFFLCMNSGKILGNFGIWGTFLFFGINSAIGVIYAFKFIPETKGKSLVEINESFE